MLHIKLTEHKEGKCQLCSAGCCPKVERNGVQCSCVVKIPQLHRKAINEYSSHIMPISSIKAFKGIDCKLEFILWYIDASFLHWCLLDKLGFPDCLVPVLALSTEFPDRVDHVLSCVKLLTDTLLLMLQWFIAFPSLVWPGLYKDSDACWAWSVGDSSPFSATKLREVQEATAFPFLNSTSAQILPHFSRGASLGPGMLSGFKASCPSLPFGMCTSSILGFLFQFLSLRTDMLQTYAALYSSQNYVLSLLWLTEKRSQMSSSKALDISWNG